LTTTLSDRMNSSELECGACLVHFTAIKGSKWLDLE